MQSLAQRGGHGCGFVLSGDEDQISGCHFAMGYWVSGSPKAVPLGLASIHKTTQKGPQADRTTSKTWIRREALAVIRSFCLFRRIYLAGGPPRLWEDNIARHDFHQDIRP
jgi:hypothetical protein